MGGIRITCGFLLAILFICLVDAADFYNQYNEYEFIFHDRTDLLTVVRDDHCFLVHVVDEEEDKLEGSQLVTTQSLLISLIELNSSRVLQALTADQMRDKYGDLLADYHCTDKHIHDVNLHYCPEGWAAYKGLCYQHHAGRLDFYAAELRCRSDGGHVVDITTQEEENFVRDLAVTDDAVWIRLSMSPKREKLNDFLKFYLSTIQRLTNEQKHLNDDASQPDHPEHPEHREHQNDRKHHEHHKHHEKHEHDGHHKHHKHHEHPDHPEHPGHPHHPEHPEHPGHPHHPEHPHHPKHPEHPEHPKHPRFFSQRSDHPSYHQNCLTLSVKTGHAASALCYEKHAFVCRKWDFLPEENDIDNFDTVYFSREFIFDDNADLGIIIYGHDCFFQAIPDRLEALLVTDSDKERIAGQLLGTIIDWRSHPRHVQSSSFNELMLRHPSPQNLKCLGRTVHRLDIELCPDGWSQHDGACYRYFTNHVDFDKAQTHCSNKVGDSRLVEITSDRQNQFVTGLVRSHKAWIGVDDRHREGHFVLSSSHSPAPYTNLGSRQHGDHHGNQDCVVLDRTHSGHWFQEECGNLHDFVCQTSFSDAVTHRTMAKPTTHAQHTTAKPTTHARHTTAKRTTHARHTTAKPTTHARHTTAKPTTHARHTTAKPTAHILTATPRMRTPVPTITIAPSKQPTQEQRCTSVWCSIRTAHWENHLI